MKNKSLSQTKYWPIINENGVSITQRHHTLCSYVSKIDFDSILVFDFFFRLRSLSLVREGEFTTTVYYVWESRSFLIFLRRLTQRKPHSYTPIMPCMVHTHRWNLAKRTSRYIWWCSDSDTFIKNSAQITLPICQSRGLIWLIEGLRTNPKTNLFNSPFWAFLFLWPKF